MRPIALAALPVLLLAGCANLTGESGASGAAPVAARADLINAEGASIGQAEFSRAPTGGVMIRVRATQLSPGQHGIHIHQNGVCEGPKFTSAGAHLERIGRDDPHGLLHPSGGEAGDLPNLTANAGGVAQAVLVNTSVAEVATAALPGIVGRSVVIHAGPDDQKTQPIGGSGDRVACGVIRAAN